MTLRGCGPIRRVAIAVCTMVLLLTVIPPVYANSFAGLNIFGFPASGGGLPGLSDVTSAAGAISASSASYSPSGQSVGYLGSGLDGVQIGTGFTWPTATHDASTVAYARNVAFESVQNNDAIAFPDTGSTWSSFPTIKSSGGDVKYMESVQLALSTESDTMPVTTGFSFPGFFSNWL